MISILRKSLNRIKFALAWVRLKGRERYLFMQKTVYESAARESTFKGEVKDYVVGSYDAHNSWADYDDYLMRYVDDSYRQKVALDFACGPCRNIIKYRDRFLRIDGCDISLNNLENGKDNLRRNNVPVPNLYQTNGDDLGACQDSHYDFIFSTIAMQHICVYEVRREIFKNMYKALKENGRISIQMGFGEDAPNSVGYFENNYNALKTNRGCDTRVEKPDYIRDDLVALGFQDFEYWIRPTGPGDSHPNWIFFTAVKK